MPDPIVGQKEIADRLRVAPNTVYQWGKRNLLPPPEGTVGGDPAWHWSTIEAWAQRTGRLPGLREAILDLLMTVAASTSPIANHLIARGFGRSIPQVWRALNDLHYEGLVGRQIPDDWCITDMGRQVVEARRSGAARLWDDNAQIPAVYVPSVAAGKPGPPIKAMRDLVGGAQAEAVHRRVQESLRERRPRS